jgi:fatty acid desaturase
MSRVQPIPNAANAVIVAMQLSVVGFCIAECRTAHRWGCIVIGAVFVLTLNSVYFAIHEAEHGLLLSNRRSNDLVGTVLSVLLPAPYTFMRNVHLAHHVINRSDDEVFDLYFQEDPAWWKKLQFLGILTGGFWLSLDRRTCAESV